MDKGLYVQYGCGWSAPDGWIWTSKGTSLPEMVLH